MLLWFCPKSICAPFLVVMALSAVPTASIASPIVGALTLSSDGVIDNGQDLTIRNSFAPENLRTGLRTGDFRRIATGLPISGGIIDLADLASFSFDIAGAGRFTDIGTGNVIGQRTASNLDIYLLGVFTPELGGPLVGFDPSDSSVRFSLTRTGSVNDFSISFSGSEAAPPVIGSVIVPEPLSLMLLGSSLLLVGLGRVMLRKG